MDIKEVAEVVRLINDEYYERTEDDEFTPLELRSNGHDILVLYCGHRIWFNGEDERNYVEVRGEEIYEPLYPYLTRCMAERNVLLKF